MSIVCNPESCLPNASTSVRVGTLLESAFAGNDQLKTIQLKTNAAQTFKAKGVTSFRTV